MARGGGSLTGSRLSLHNGIFCTTCANIIFSCTTISWSISYVHRSPVRYFPVQYSPAQYFRYTMFSYNVFLNNSFCTTSLVQHFLYNIVYTHVSFTIFPVQHFPCTTLSVQYFMYNMSLYNILCTAVSCTQRFIQHFPVQHSRYKNFLHYYTMYNISLYNRNFDGDLPVAAGSRGFGNAETASSNALPS